MISWTIGTERDNEALLGFVGDYHVASVYESGTWWTWDRGGIGGENGVEKDLVKGHMVFGLPNVFRAIREAEAAARRQGFAD